MGIKNGKYWYNIYNSQTDADYCLFMSADESVWWLVPAPLIGQLAKSQYIYKSNDSSSTPQFFITDDCENDYARYSRFGTTIEFIGFRMADFSCLQEIGAFAAVMAGKIAEYERNPFRGCKITT